MAHYDGEDEFTDVPPEKPPLWQRVLIWVGAAMAAGVLGLVALLVVAVQGLEDEAQLKDYQPPQTSRIYAGDGKLIAEFADEHRIFVPIQSIPRKLQEAFISAEDKSFWEHEGIDYIGLVRATFVNIGTIFTGEGRIQGASTITQQVAKNMLLTSDRTIMRKLKEAFLARRIERAFDKQKIIELYLNEIFLGNRAYGVAAAALNYFDKSLDDLSLAEMAFMAALPQAPSEYGNPRNRDRVVERRNWVLSRMAANGVITEQEANEAAKEPLKIVDRMAGDQYLAAGSFVEDIRQDIKKRFSEDMLNKGGLSVRTSLDTRLQLAAVRALRRGLEQYDRRHGWRGPVKMISADGDIAANLRELAPVPTMTGWNRAVVSLADRSGVKVKRADGVERSLDNNDVQWAAQGARANKDFALRVGAGVYVQCPDDVRRPCGLRQRPAVQGALVAMDPHTGRVLAMVGGYTFNEGELNRARTKRQPGSSYKPLVYAAALDPCGTGDTELQLRGGCGLTPATLIDDAPLADGTGAWSPENYTRQFRGATTMRIGLQQSVNSMTARLAYAMTPQRVLDYGVRLGVFEPGEQIAVPALALGAGETSVLRMTAAYGMFVNGGRRITPTLIDRVQDRGGVTLFNADARTCPACLGAWTNAAEPPELPDPREQVLDPITSRQVVSMLEGAVKRGTGAAINSLGRTLGGKTGTTNDYKDAWFVGFSADLVVGVWVGFDTPKDMGEGETGGRLAAPVFRDFMGEALKGQPDKPFVTKGLAFVKVDYQTGALPGPTTAEAFMEGFRPGTEPTSSDVSTTIIGRDAAIDANAFGEAPPGEQGGAGAPSTPGAPAGPDPFTPMSGPVVTAPPRQEDGGNDIY
jgi:penicillin-binding protein 1A